MPSVKNPGLLVPRAGQVPAKTVPSAGLIEPNRDVEPLKAHLSDPSRAHMASAIGILDAGGFYASDEVEGVLQEVGTTGFYARQSGVVQGCLTFVSGVDLEVAANSYILLRGNVRDIAGLTATIPVPAGTYYAYIDSAVTLQISAVLPSITNNNTVLLNKVVTDGFGGVVLSDARFFVARLDRKPDLTLRSEASPGDNAAEACFVTPEAALFWLANITQDVKKTLIIRGVLVLTDEMQLPTGGVTIRGEGDAIIRTSLGVANAIDLNGQDDIIIENLTFESNGAALLRFAVSDVTDLSNLIIRNCQFNPLGTTWNGGAIYLSGTSYTDVTIERCSGTVAGHGVRVDQPIGTLVIRDCDFTGTAPLASNYGYWIAKGASSQYLSFSLENCKATAFEYGLYSSGATVLGEGSVKNCKFLGVVGGVSCFDQFVIEACEIRLNSTDGLYGVICGDGTVVRNCTIATTRGAATYLAANAAGVFAYNRCIVDGCTISGFNSTSTYRADGVRISPSGIEHNHNRITNNHFINSAIYTFSFPSIDQYGLVIQGNTFLSDTATVLAYGAISANGQKDFVVADNVIRCNTTASTGGFDYGIEINAGELTFGAATLDSGTSHNASIKGNVVTSPAVDGIRIFGAVSQFDVSGNTVDGYLLGNTTAPSAYGIHAVANTTVGSMGTPAGIGHDGTISSNRLTRLYSGIYLNGTATYKVQAVKIADNAISYCAYINGAAYDVLSFTNSGSKGIGVEYATDISITDNNVSNIGIMLLDDGVTLPPSGIDVASNGIYIWNTYPAQVEGNVITGLNATSGGQSHGINAVVISGIGVLGERDIRIANNTLELLQAPLDSGTATAGGASTLTDGGKTWTVNAYTNCVVTITAGTGAGQTEYIASNTATTLTVTTPWATPPDGTSVYSILQSEVNGTAAIRHIQRQILGASGFIGLQVDGNRIYTHESTSAQEPFAYGIWLDGDNGASGASYLDTRICNNMIHGWSDAANRAGILVSGDSVGALNLRAVSIDGNTLVASKLGATTSSAAISLLNCYNGSIRDCSVSGNLINGESDTLVARTALYFGIDGAEIESLKVDSNVLIGERGALITQSTSTTANFKGLSFCGNRFRGGILVNTTTSGNLYDCKFDGNSGMGINASDGVDVGIYLSCSEFYNVSISDNDFVLLDDSLGIGFDSNVKSTLVSNLKVDGNLIRLKNTSGSLSGGSLKGIDVSIDSNLSGLSVCNNNVDFYLDGNSYARCGIRVYTDTDVPVAWRGVNVSGNVIRGIFRNTGSYPEGGALVFDTQKNDAATDYALLYNAAFIGNRGLGQPYDQGTFTAYGFYLRLTGTATSGSAVSVTNNAFTEFVDTLVGTCAQFLGTIPANSICQSNISQDGGGSGFTGFGFSINADNIDY
jgi:hypothetical protein